MRLLTTEQVRELDRRAIEEWGIPGPVLMENAGRSCVDLLERRFGQHHPGPVLILAGKGNNGGDGFVIARHLANRGWRVSTLVLAERREIDGDAGLNLGILEAAAADLHFAPDEETLDRALGAAAPALVVDALLGTGLGSEVKGRYARAIDWINRSSIPVVAVDVPSGVDAATGRILGCAVRADLTVTFAAAKIGLVLHPALEAVGELVVADIGIPRTLAQQSGDRIRLVDADEARSLLPQRPAEGHKGTFGHLLVLAGSPGKSGAAALAAEGGLRSGAGLVTVASPSGLQPLLAAKLTEAMTSGLAEVDGTLSLQALDQIRTLWEGKSALALGPGLGTTGETAALVRRLLRECPLPVVVDADGLNVLAGHAELLRERSGPPPVLTPHPGEMARLAACTVAEVEADRCGCALEFARSHGAVVVLKGARTVTASPDGRVLINASGNPALASGGTGDALTGLIGGLLAQGCSPLDAAGLGAYLHGRAADRLVPRFGRAGMIATDLVRELPAARFELEG